MATTINFTQPWNLTVPDSAVTVANGEATITLTSFAGGALSGTSLAISGNATVGGTLGITGATTAAALACTTLAASSNATVGGTLGVTGATTCAALTASGTVTLNGTLDCNSIVDLSGATLTLPANTQFSLRYVSQTIVHGDLTGGGAVSTIALTGEPMPMIPLAAYMVTSSATTSSDVNTTGLTCSVGVAGVVEGYVAAATVFGAAGRKEAFGGTLLNGYRAADALIATFTATGPAPDCAHIDSLALKVVVLYAALVAE